MKKKVLFSLMGFFIFVSCEKMHILPFQEHKESAFNKLARNFPGDVAVEWMKLQLKISRTTPGFGPGPATRAFAYSGLACYESIVDGMPGYNSVASFMMGLKVQPYSELKFIYYPASANAAMAYIIKNLIPAASDEAKAEIDLLESEFNQKFGDEVSDEVLEKSIDYGRSVANSIFEWAKTDGFAEAMAKNSSYVVPTGFGLWQPTPPAFSAPVNVYLNDVRTFIPNSPALTLPPAPIQYSEDPGSPFYNQVMDVYTVSQSLTDYDILTVKTWGEFPGNYTNALRYQQIAIQLVDEADLSLDVAAHAFAKHGMAIQEAVICVFNAKYIHNVVRPITYIQDVLGYSSWSAVNTTPPHPEYPAAHATVGRASSKVLESIFGTKYSFTDRTHENLYGARNYNSLKAYSDEAGWSRVLGGIHYRASVEAGTQQGEKVGLLINQLPFKK